MHLSFKIVGRQIICPGLITSPKRPNNILVVRFFDVAFSITVGEAANTIAHARIAAPFLGRLSLPGCQRFSLAVLLWEECMQWYDKQYSFQEKRQLLQKGRQSACDYLFAAKFLLRDMREDEFTKRLNMMVAVIKSEPLIQHDCSLLLDYLAIKARPTVSVKTQRAYQAISTILKQVYS